jgi:hypothetical protein
MISLALTAIVFGSMVWVYVDASGHKIGKVEGAGGFFNLSAGAWGTVTGFLWIVGFPSYLFKRSTLMETARAHPVEPKGRVFKTFVFGAIAFAVIAVSAAVYMQGTLPSCDSPDVVKLADTIIKGSPLVKLTGLQVTGLSMVAQKSYDSGTEKRLCRGMITSDFAGTQGIEYSVEWHDKAKGLIWVQIVP